MGKKSCLNTGFELIKNIKGNYNFFEPTVIVFPNLNVVKWFKTFWLKNEDSILMNVKMITVSDFILSIIDKVYKFIDKNDYKLIILKNIVQERINIKEINDYIKDKKGNIVPTNLYDIAETLSSLFIQYDKDNTIISGFQKDIYDIVTKELEDREIVTKRDVLNREYKEVKNLHFFDYDKYDEIDKRIIENYLSSYQAYVYDGVDGNHEINLSCIEAPSKIREIEAVHTEICKIIKDNKNTRFNDFLIVSNNIEDYISEIKQVFEQDDKEFVKIPYSLKIQSTQYTDTKDLLSILVNIIHNKYFSRNDIYSLLCNSLVRDIRGISLEDASKINKKIITIRVYNSVTDDFNYLTKRLLLDKLVGNNTIVTLDNKEYIPFSNSMIEDELEIKIIDLFEDLKSLIEVCSKDYFNNEDIINFNKQLSKWFMRNDEYYNYTSRELFKALRSWEEYGLCEVNCDKDVLIFYLTDSLTKVSKTLEPFSSGVTFTDFSNVSYMIDYVFFIGANSSNLPKQVIKSELDLNHDKNEYQKEKESFFEQIQKTGKHFYISYLLYDYANDQELYPSIFIKELTTELHLESNKINLILDETRPWGDLYTKKEFIQKDYYLKLGENIESDNITKVKTEPLELKVVKLSDMQNFLEDPLIFKVNNTLGKIGSLNNDSLNDYVPIKPSNLDYTIAIKKLILKMYENYQAGTPKIITEKEKEDIKNYLYLNRIFPVTDNKKFYFDQILSFVIKKFETISQSSTREFEIISNKVVKLNNGTVEWELESAYNIFVKYTSENSIEYQEIVYDTKNNSEFKVIVFALMDIASMNIDTDLEVTISNEKHILNSDKASNALNSIYNEMIDYEVNYSAYFDTKLDEISTLEEYINKLYSDNGYWRNFNLKDLLNPEIDLGYTKDKFKEKLSNNIKKIKDYIEF